MAIPHRNGFANIHINNEIRTQQIARNQWNFERLNESAPFHKTKKKYGRSVNKTVLNCPSLLAINTLDDGRHIEFEQWL